MRWSVLILATSTACFSEIGDYRVAGDRVFVERGDKLFECRAGGPGAVGVGEYGSPTACIDLDLEVPHGWHVAGDRLVLVDGVADGDDESCAGHCRGMTVRNLSTGESTVLLERHRGVFGARTNGRWVVWADRRHDDNGLCFFPRGDPDCNVDVYGYDLEAGVERRLTAQSSVGSGRWTGEFWTLAVDSKRVVYVDRRAVKDPDCYEADGVRTTPDCDQHLYEIDLETGSERPLVTTPGTNASPRLSGAVLTWVHADGNGLEVWARSLDDDASARMITNAIDDDRYGHANGHVVTMSDDAIFATSIDTGTSVRIDAEDAASAEPDAEGDTVVWREKDGDTIIHYDLSTRRRVPFLPSS